jgi:hypothetical protein
MPRKRKTVERDEAPIIEARKSFSIIATSPEDARRDVARMMAAPETAAARAIGATEGTKGLGEDLDVPELVDCLREQAAAINGGNMAHVESMLANQATALQSLFARMIERGMGSELLAQYEAHMRIALRAQAQCVRTLETLAAIRNPPVIFAKQANISAGPQQVNNGSRAQESPIEQSKVLEAQHGERLDIGAAAAASGANPRLATVEAIDGAKNRSR